MTHSPPPSPDLTDRYFKAIEQLSVEIAELRQLLAALVIVLADDSRTSEIGDTADALSNWAMNEFDFELLAEIMGDFLPPSQKTTTPAPRQGELFPQSSAGNPTN